jgi:hypothetical protein
VRRRSSAATPPREGVPDQYRDAWATSALTPGGSRLFAVANSGRGLRFEASVYAWKRHACFVAGRELTRREWKEALPG